MDLTMCYGERAAIKATTKETRGLRLLLWLLWAFSPELFSKLVSFQQSQRLAATFRGACVPWFRGVVGSEQNLI